MRECPVAHNDNPPWTEHDRRVRIIADGAREMLKAVGEDPEREGLLKTPNRYAEAMLFFTKGYECTLTGTCCK
jgi:GTP cyclohydrolase I